MSELFFYFISATWHQEHGPESVGTHSPRPRKPWTKERLQSSALWVSTADVCLRTELQTTLG